MQQIDHDRLRKLYQLVKTPSAFKRLVDAVAAAVARSTEEHPVSQAGLITPSLTRDEQNLRVDWCLNWAMEKMGDHQWAVERICDKVGHALADSLKTKPEPEQKGDMWSAS